MPWKAVTILENLLRHRKNQKSMWTWLPIASVGNGLPYSSLVLKQCFCSRSEVSMALPTKTARARCHRSGLKMAPIKYSFVVWRSIHFRSDTIRAGDEGLSFYYPRLLYCLNQMLAVMSLSQRRVSSSKTVRPRAPYRARCIEYAVSTWSAVCSEAPHSQFGEGARPHLYMDEWNCPTPVRRRLSLTKLLGVSPSQQAWNWSQAQKHETWKHFYSTPFFICDLSIQRRGCQVWQGCPRDSAHLAQTGVWILASLGEYLRTHLKDHTRYDRSPEIHGKPRSVSLPFGEAQLAGCLRVQVGDPLEWDAGIQ